jgi:hypothetical protein
VGGAVGERERLKKEFMSPNEQGNISGANQPLRENYENFNLSHMMLIQRSA